MSSIPAVRTVRVRFTEKKGERAVSKRGVQQSDTKSLTKMVLDRKVGRKFVVLRREGLVDAQTPQTFVSRLDRNFDGVGALVKQLQVELEGKNLTSMHRAVVGICRKLVDNPGQLMYGGSTDVHPDRHDYELGGEGRNRRLDREGFVSLGGPELLMQVFTPKVVERENNELSAATIGGVSDMWNEALVILRELCYTEPDLAERLVSIEFLIFLFSLMSHSILFDSAVGLMEEVLAGHPCTLSLSAIPDLYKLLDSLSARRLAHLCRVFSLLVFEPEDKQLMESTRVLKSTELLQMRRDRMARTNSVIDRNQAILLNMPELLPRLVFLIRVLNFAPPLGRVGANGADAAAFPIEVLMMQRDDAGAGMHWPHLDELVTTASQTTPIPPPPIPNPNPPVEAIPPPPIPNPLPHPPAVPNNRFGTFVRWLRRTPAAAEPVLQQLPAPEEVEPPAPERVERGVEILADLVRRGNQLPEGVADAANALMVHLAGDDRELALVDFFGAAAGAGRRGEANIRLNLTPKQSARLELELSAILLAPHQVEVLFTLCALLSGRRKVSVQAALADLGLIDVLTAMFPRLSWGSSSVEAAPPERVHGPECQCDAGSALRIQYLRLVHNFCDRECSNTSTKRLLLSPETRRQLEEAEAMHDKQKAIDMICCIQPNSTNKGLLDMIIEVLINTPAESPIRFWLASCVESFLRGGTVLEQLIIAKSGLLRHLVAEVTATDAPISGNVGGSLQTAFDLLGELSKGNKKILMWLEQLLTPFRLEQLLAIVHHNLVDSNVFVRSLVLSMEHIHTQETTNRNDETTNRNDGTTLGYLQQSWWDTPVLVCGCGSAMSHQVPAAPTDPLVSSMNGLSLTDEYSPAPLEKQNDGGTHDGKAEIEDGKAKVEDGKAEVEVPKEDGNAGTENRKAEESSWGAMCEYWPIPPPEGLTIIPQFLQRNLTMLLCDLMSVVDISNINHENICCLNTVIVVLVLVRRRGLSHLAKALATIRHAYARIRYIRDTAAVDGVPTTEPVRGLTGEEVLRTFRKLLWFWTEYYMRRGRDRLSLEFSSHVRFEEWEDLVGLLCADDGSPTSLLNYTPILPQSAYARKASSRTPVPLGEYQ